VLRITLEVGRGKITQAVRRKVVCSLALQGSSEI
jgi:hypothetical protein